MKFVDRNDNYGSSRGGDFGAITFESKINGPQIYQTTQEDEYDSDI